MRDNKDILQQYVSDMIALDEHILEAIERQLGDDRLDNYPGARQIVSSIKSTLASHSNGLKQQIKSVGGEASGPVKEAVGTVAGLAAGLYDKVRHDPVSKMLRDDYTALSLTSISYTMLHTTALALKHDAVAASSANYLKEVTPLIVEISRIMPEIVVKDLADEDVSINTGVAERAVGNTQAAWNSENTR